MKKHGFMFAKHFGKMFIPSLRPKTWSLTSQKCSAWKDFISKPLNFHWKFFSYPPRNRVKCCWFGWEWALFLSLIMCVCVCVCVCVFVARATYSFSMGLYVSFKYFTGEKMFKNLQFSMVKLFKLVINNCKQPENYNHNANLNSNWT